MNRKFGEVYFLKFAGRQDDRRTDTLITIIRFFTDREFTDIVVIYMLSKRIQCKEVIKVQINHAKQ